MTFSVETVATPFSEDDAVRAFLILVAALISFLAVAMAEPPISDVAWNFEDAVVGQLPKGWSAAKTGDGEAGVWKVIEDASAPSGTKVLAQTSDSPGPMFNLCVAGESSFKDVALAVSFKAVKGKIDQGGGLVWRYIDANNYFVVRINPLEDNFRLYKVVNGKRTQIATNDGLKIPVGQWHKMSVSMKGDQIECSLDGKRYLEATDATITKPGKVGFWTKADAQSYFDDFRVSASK